MDSKSGDGSRSDQEKFLEWALSGRVEFNTSEGGGSIHFHPDCAEYCKAILEKSGKLNFVAVDAEYFPLDLNVYGLARDFSRGVLSNYQGHLNNKAAFDAWDKGNTRIEQNPNGKYCVISQTDNGDVLLKTFDTEVAAKNCAKNPGTDFRNVGHDNFSQEKVNQALKDLHLNEDVLAMWSRSLPEGETVLSYYEVDDLIKLYDGRIPVPIGSVIVFGDGVAMVAVGWDQTSRCVIWMQDWSSGDMMWMRNIASGYDAKKWKAWNYNYKRNKKKINRGIRSLEGSHKGKPVILVGNGPSLMRNMHQLRAHEDLKIVTCNRGLNYLDKFCEKNGGADLADYYIVADYEGRPDWYKRLETCRAEVLSYIFADPDIEKFTDPNRFYWFVLSNYIAECQEEVRNQWLGWLSAGTSVSTAMIHYAVHVLEADPVILIGFDHAWTNGFKYPGVKWTPEVLNGRSLSSFQVARDIYGCPSITDDMLHLQKMQNDAIPFLLMNTDRRLINASEEGILSTEFWETMTLDDAYKWFIEKTEEAPELGKLSVKRGPEDIWWIAAKEHLLASQVTKETSALFK
jgi:hypothetical protein